MSVDDRFDDASAGPVRVADFDALDEPDETDEPGPAVRVASFDLDDLDDLDRPADAGSGPVDHGAGGTGDGAGGPDGARGTDDAMASAPTSGLRTVDLDDPGAGRSPRARVVSFDDPPDDTAPSGDRSARDRRESRGGRRGSRTGTGPPPDDETRAKEICLRLLTDRARTVKELRDALVRKEIPEDVADRVLERFDEVGLVDDEAFAGQWVRSRHRHRGLGKRAIAQELRRKGVAKEVADEALTEIDAASEEARARELVEKKIRTVKVGTREERASASRRLVGMLARKGYGGGVAYSVVREAIAARGAEEDEMGEEPPED